MAELPTAAVTFLFTDIEGSTRLWEQQPEAMQAAQVRHDALLRHVIEVHEGRVFKTVGDQFCAAFSAAPPALAAALAAQRALQAEPWGELGALTVRMALHTGPAQEREGDYFGASLSRVARLCAAAHGRQILLSLATEQVTRDALPEGADLKELGEHRLRDLARPERIFQLLHPALPADFPRLRTLEAFAHNLPVQLTSFIGREREMAEVKQRLGGGTARSTVRLLTLTGAGGCGKTRLALQVAADLVEEYPQGVWLVELAPLADSRLVLQAVATVLGVHEEPGRPLMESLTAYLRPRTLLLLLDNCEHLITACAQVADSLLRASPNLRILATSREVLGIAGETVFRVPSLQLPDPDRLSGGGSGLAPDLLRYEGVRLFHERATAVQPSFAVTDRNALSVVQVCRRLDGIPMALELAAARVKVLSVEQIATRLDDQFRLLTGGSRTALPRQQTLRALIDWSYDLLSEAERALLRRLSVFAGGWTLEAAEAVCAGHEIEAWEVLDLMSRLVDKSLVVVEVEAGDDTRYRLLETVRQYSRERLLEAGEAEVVREQHARYFTELAEEAYPAFFGPGQTRWSARIEEEHDNVRAALAWSQSDDRHPEIAVRLSGAMWWFWHLHGYYTEGRRWLEGVLRIGEMARQAARSDQLPGSPTGSASAGSPAVILPPGIPAEAWARALFGAGGLAMFHGDQVTARPLMQESAALFRELEDKQSLARALRGLGWVELNLGAFPAAEAAIEESLLLDRELGDILGMARNLHFLGQLARMQGNHEAAKAHWEEGLALARQGNDQWTVATLLLMLGKVAEYRGMMETARSLCEESLVVGQKLRYQRAIADCVESLAAIASIQGAPERAARLFGAAEAAREVMGVPLLPSTDWGIDHAPQVAATRAALGEEAFAETWAAGRALPLEEAVAYALTDPDR